MARGVNNSLLGPFTGKNNVALNAQTLTLIEKTLQYIKKKESITLLQLEQYLHRYMNTAGKEELRHLCKNVMIWTQVSNEFTQFFVELQATKRVFFSVADESLYPKNKKRPQLPIAQRWSDHDTLHWLPMTLTLTQEAKEKGHEG